MKMVRFLIWSVILITSVTASARAQVNSKLFSLPENATLEETQDWLSKALPQNGSYRVKNSQSVKELGRSAANKPGSADSGIVWVKFKDCQMSFQTETLTQLDSSGQKTPNSPFPAMDKGMWENTKVIFDLKDIDPDEVTLQNIEADRLMTVISMRTFNYKRTIQLKGNVETGNVNVSVANIVVSENIGEQIKDGLLHAMSLCRATKP